MKSNLFKRGFLSLIATQFFGAANDNILKIVLTYMVIDGAWAGRLGDGGQGLVSLCFTVPFILLSGYAGQFADRNSKRYVSVLVKVLEIPIAMIAMIGFWTGNLWITLSALIALTCQSSFFGPAKYGMIPELVSEGELSRANGTINMMTNIAVIVGTLVGGQVADRYNPLVPTPGVEPQLWLPGVMLLGVAVAGLVAVLFLPKLEASDPDLVYDSNPFSIYIKTIKEAWGKPLLTVMLAWGYFYLLAGLALLIIPEYTLVLSAYRVDRAEASLLLGVMGVAIGVGSAVAGLVSGHHIRPGLVPIGAFGLSLFFLLLGLVPPAIPDADANLRVAFSSISGFIFGAGFFAGFYIIPLQALLQHLAPKGERGRFLGTANGISFAFLTIASFMYWLIRPAFGDAPQRIFLISAALMLAGSGYFIYKLRQHQRQRRVALDAEGEKLP